MLEPTLPLLHNNTHKILANGTLSASAATSMTARSRVHPSTDKMQSELNNTTSPLFDKIPTSTRTQKLPSPMSCKKSSQKNCSPNDGVLSYRLLKESPIQLRLAQTQ